jgi:hypothetical protein
VRVRLCQNEDVPQPLLLFAAGRETKGSTSRGRATGKVTSLLCSELDLIRVSTWDHSNCVARVSVQRAVAPSGRFWARSKKTKTSPNAALAGQKAVPVGVRIIR